MGKIWLIIAIVVAVIGCVALGGMMALDWDISKLTTQKYETNTHTLPGNYQNIKIVTNTADISFVPSQSNTVTCYEEKTAKHSVRVEGDTLIVEVVNSKKWYDYIGIYFEAPKITLSIPQGEYGALCVKSDTGNVELPKDFRFASVEITESTGRVNVLSSVSGDLKIKTSTGDVRVEGLSAGALDVSVSTGKVNIQDVTCAGDVEIDVTTGKTELTNLTCKNLDSDGSTGKMLLQNVIAEDKLSVERSTGDVVLTKCDAGEIEIETDTGDVTGSLLSSKIFFTETDTGKINVPKSMTGGKCEITTDTGDIRITVE